MSKTLNQAAINSFDNIVKHEAQQGGVLEGTVRTKTGVVGTTHRFPLLGSGQAARRVPGTDVTPMNLAHSNQTATLQGWSAPEYTDIFDQQEVNFDERQLLGEAIGKAIGRRRDQIIIDALDAASTTHTVAKSIGGSNTNLNMDKLRRASRLLGDNGVEMNGESCHYAGSYYGREGLLGETEVTSADYNSVRALTTGELNSFLGMKFHWIATRGEGGLTLSTNDRSNYCWDKMSMGLATGIDERTEVNYIPQKTSWLAHGMFTAGATHIDLKGIVEVTTHEA